MLLRVSDRAQSSYSCARALVVRDTSCEKEGHDAERLVLQSSSLTYPG